MSRQVLHRIAIPHKWTPAEWQYRLADQIGANPVLMIFRHAAVRAQDGALVFSDSFLATRAEQFRRGLEKILGEGLKIEFETLTPAPVETGRPRVHIRVT